MDSLRVGFDLSIPGSDLSITQQVILGNLRSGRCKQDVSLKFKTRLNYGDGFGDSDGLPFLRNFSLVAFGLFVAIPITALGPSTERGTSGW